MKTIYAVLAGAFFAASAVAAPPELKPKLAVTKTGNGQGTVRSAAGGIDCGAKCSNDYTLGVPVRLEAAPGTGLFAGWSGDCAGTNPVCSFAMDRSRTVTARFVLPKLDVKKQREVKDARVVSNGNTIDCGARCSAELAAGSRVTLEAKDLPESWFAKWSNSATGPRTEVDMSAMVVGISLQGDASFQAVLVGSRIAFRVEGPNGSLGRCDVESETHCALALQKGRTFKIVSESGPLNITVQPGGSRCMGKETCDVTLSLDRPTTVSVTRSR